MRIAKLTLVLAIALINYQALCTMSCTVQACALNQSTDRQNVPQCPFHPSSQKSQTPPCSHQFISTAMPSPHLGHALGAAASMSASLAAFSSVEVSLEVRRDVRLAASPSPPGLASFSSTVLRI